MFFLKYILTILKYIFFEKLNKNNFYIKIVDLDEVYNFLVLSFLFKVVKMLKKLIAYLHLRVFFTFHIHDLTPLEPNLTAVA